MTFSNEWEQRYQQLGKMSMWPWSDLVSLYLRSTKKIKTSSTSAPKVLELGCATGANIPFFLDQGVDYFGIEGSASMVNDLRIRFPVLNKQVVNGDFTNQIPFTQIFDVIIDRSSLTHNTTSAIKNCLSLLNSLLLPGSVFIGVDWFSTLHGEIKYGLADEDENTKKLFSEGLFKNVGRVHFSDQLHLEELFSGYKFEILELKKIARLHPGPTSVHATWNFVAIKL